jgi:hypothetical protein
MMMSEYNKINDLLKGFTDKEVEIHELTNLYHVEQEQKLFLENQLQNIQSRVQHKENELNLLKGVWMLSVIGYRVLLLLTHNL